MYHRNCQMKLWKIITLSSRISISVYILSGIPWDTSVFFKFHTIYSGILPELHELQLPLLKARKLVTCFFRKSSGNFLKKLSVNSQVITTEIPEEIGWGIPNGNIGWVPVEIVGGIPKGFSNARFKYWVQRFLGSWWTFSKGTFKEKLNEFQK